MSLETGFRRTGSTLAGMAAWVLRPFMLPARVQFATLPFRYDDADLEFLLVTSRDTGRWILPKGWPSPAGRPLETAVDEAWEEAGIRGQIHPTPIAEYRYRKKLDAGHEVDCVVVVYPLEVRYLANDYPEAEQRERRWMPAGEAAERISEPELRDLFLDATLALKLRSPAPR